MAAPDQLTVYNGAVRLLKQPKLATLTDDIQLRYAFDDAWADSFVNYCLEEGFWYFATRSSQLSFDPTFTKQFGFTYRFVKPDDWIRTCAVASDEYYNAPLTGVVDEAGSWFADISPIYVRYVSNDPSYGLNFGIWPSTFTLFVEAELALRVAPGLTASDSLIKEIIATRKARLADAKGKAAMAQSTAFPPLGTWTLSRRGQRSSQDLGRRDQLLG